VSFDTIIVGAGLSGLVCATRLAAAGQKILVLEARDRIGGRVHSVPFAGGTIDLGGQWMSVGQPRLAALAQSLGIASFPHVRDGAPLFALPPLSLFRRISTSLARWRGARRIARLAKRPPADDAALADWLASIHDPTARALLAMHSELIFATDPASLSLLHYLHVFSSTGGFSPPGADLPGGAREHRFVGGAQAIARALARPLADRIALAAEVVAITRDRTLAVHTASESFHAQHVVLALPPPLAREIAAGTLPSHPAFAAMQLGKVVKCFAAYPRPFWRDAGLSGEAFRPHGPIRATVALAPPPDGPIGTTGPQDSTNVTAILLAFIVGEDARTWHTRDADARRALVVETFVEQFGPAAAEPLAYREADWSSDRFSGGCVAGVPPGTAASAAACRTPIENLHFAGTETADAWPGYMEGAIESGERAAAEILASLASLAPG
jgi:monoamine oxidase